MRALVVDDEALARGRLVRMLARIPGVVVAGEAGTGAEALAKLAEIAPDVVLLDVEMPELDGLAFAERPGVPPVVFTTAHAQFAADAFDLDAVDYLLKPVRQDQLERALERVRRRAASAHPAAAATGQLAVHSAAGVRFVAPERVDVFRALDKYTAFELEGEQLLLRESLDALEARLAPLGFVRMHRAALVRLAAVAALAHEGEGLVARLTDGTAVPVSRRQAAEVRRLLGLRR